ncbi:MAG: hypothetical protein R6V55_16855 [Desulfovermiculus sp.]
MEAIDFLRLKTISLNALESMLISSLFFVSGIQTSKLPLPIFWVFLASSAKGLVIVFPKILLAMRSVQVRIKPARIKERKEECRLDKICDLDSETTTTHALPGFPCE